MQEVRVEVREEERNNHLCYSILVTCSLANYKIQKRESNNFFHFLDLEMTQHRLWMSNYLLNKWANLTWFLIGSFYTNSINFTTKWCEKCPSSVWHQDSNSQPSDYQSSPLTTRPGLLPKCAITWAINLTWYSLFLVSVQQEIRPFSEDKLAA